jgi:hypothetical protein
MNREQILDILKEDYLLLTGCFDRTLLDASFDGHVIVLAIGAYHFEMNGHRLLAICEARFQGVKCRKGAESKCRC